MRLIRKSSHLCFAIAAIMVILLLNPVRAEAANTTNILIKIPGCNSLFNLTNVSCQYRDSVSSGVHNYEFFFPGGPAVFSCDSPAFVLYERPDFATTQEYYYSIFSGPWDSSMINEEENLMCAMYVKSDGTLTTTLAASNSSKTHIIFHYNISEDDMSIMSGKGSNAKATKIPADQLHPITALSAVPVITQANTDSLATYSGNNAEFNAYYYYTNYIDLQIYVGASGDALLNHWNEYGKKEGRIANRPL